MKKLSRNLLLHVAILSSLGCAAKTPTTNPASVVKLAPNTAYVGPDGTVVLKGMGDSMSGTFVCVLPTGPYRVLVDSAQKQALKLDILEYGGDLGFELKREQRLSRLYDISERMLATQQVYGNACILLGDGAFGPICTQNEKGKCSSGMPKATLNEYTKFLKSQLDILYEHLGARSEPASAASVTHGDVRQPDGVQQPPTEGTE